MKEVVIASAARTPIGKFMGSFSEVTAADLGVIAAKEAMARAAVSPSEVGELIFGSARQAGNGPNIARQIAVRSGIPQETPSFTINKACGSGLKAIILGWQAINSGDADIVVCGGTENMSRVPFFLDRARFGYRLGNAELVDAMYRDGFLCPLSKLLMGETAEVLADRYEISREEQDHFALGSQHKAEAAIAAGRFRDEIVPVPIKGRKGAEILVEEDEHPRAGATMEGLGKLPPVFKKDGSVTAGNSSGITDGAAAVVLMDASKARERGLVPLAKMEGYGIGGVAPEVMGIGVVPAVGKLLGKTGLSLEDFDLIEINEAFAAQVLACDRELHFDHSKLNVNGAAIALGHPVGATGARIVVTLLHEMARRQAKRGLATLCVSGGLGLAASFIRGDV